MPDPAITSQLPEGKIDPKELAKLEKSIKGKEIAPQVSEQSASFVDWKQIQNELGQPFDVERIPLKKLRQMRRDTMISFGLHYKKTPLARANWHCEAKDANGPNAQIAAWFDSAWRKIHSTYIFQHTTDFDFGFSSMCKRFASGNPGGVYVDPTEADPAKRLKPVWDEGSIDPIIWKTFVGLPPERVQPRFNKAGEFDGILYETTPGQQSRSTGFASALGKGNDKERIIDVYHALWTTNDKPSVHGNIFGYPLIAHAFRYWWSYWFRWAMADRAFERLAIPPMVAFHPEGYFEDPDNPDERMPYHEIAIQAAEQLRSNAIAAVPSTLATAGLEERGTQMREWEFKFIETSGNTADLFDATFNYLDIMKLRSLWVPEQAFIEGEGGSSSRNVATQMGEIFEASQNNKWDEIAFHINNYIFPQILALNFPEFVNNSGTVKIVGHGFAKEDLELQKQLIQLFGQSDPTKLGVDIQATLKQLNVPLLTPEQQAQEQADLIAKQALAGPPAVPGVTAQAIGFNPTVTNGGSQPEPNAPGTLTGFDDQVFVYVQPNEFIELSDNDDFLAGLPTTSHYQDKAMRALAVQMRRVWLTHLKAVYPEFADFVKGSDFEFEDEGAYFTFADESSGKRLTKRQATVMANKLLKEWSVASDRLKKVTDSSKAIIAKMVKRAAAVNAKKFGVKDEIPDDAMDDFINRQTAALVKSVHNTAKEDMKTVLVNALQKGQTQKEIATEIKEHFKDVQPWKADEIARSEIRDAYNEATIVVAETGGYDLLRAHDAQLGPTDFECEQRDGKLYTPKEARKEGSYAKTHPRCTLEFEPIANAEFSVKNVNSLPENAPDGAEAWFDAETVTAYVPVSLSDDDSQEFLNAVADHLQELSNAG